MRFRLLVPDRDADPVYYDAEYLRHADPNHHIDICRLREVRVVGTFQHLLDGRDWDLVSGVRLTRRSYADCHLGAIFESDLLSLAAGYFEYNYVVIFRDSRAEPCWISDPCSLYRSACGGRESSAFIL